MTRSTAKIDTEKAGIYLRKFCRHFSHKLVVRLDENWGEVAYEWGLCKLVVENNTLLLIAEAPDDDSLDRVEAVVAGHLERFAAKEQIAVIWSRQQ